MKKIQLLLVFFSALLLIMSCASAPVFNAPFNRPIKIAVLPFENQTTDLPAGYLARLLFERSLRSKGYDVIDNGVVDNVLKEVFGITDGGQLNSASAKEIQTKMGVEGLLYGTVITAKYSTLGVYAKKEATLLASVKMDGKEVWSKQKTVKETKLGSIANPLGALADQLIEKTIEKTLSKLLGHPLSEQFEEIIQKMQKEMPREKR